MRLQHLCSYLTSFALVLTVGVGPGAAAHGGHAGELFAPEFAEFANAQFRIRPLPANEVTSYVLFEDGRKVYLDSQLRESVQAMARSLVHAREPRALHHDVQWREWSQHVAESAVDNVKHLFSRRFVLELAGSGVQAFYRFGVLSATLIVIAEALEHTIISPLLPGVPLCQAVYASCVYFSREAQEIANVLNPHNLKPLTLRERIGRWVSSRRQRRVVSRAMKHVYRTADDADLTRLARHRSFRDFDAGAMKIYGGWFGRGFFRNTLADVVAEDHDHEDPVAVGDVRVPVIEDLSKYRDAKLRILRTEEYIAYVELIFEYAQLAAEDLTRVTDAGVRVPLGTTWRKAPGFLALNRDLARMRRSLDIYAFGLRMRAFQAAPRSLATLTVDQDFATSLATFLRSFNERLGEIDALAAGPLPASSPLRITPDRAKARVREWMRTASFCDDLLTAGLLAPSGFPGAH